jgi:hypothetical protein
MQRECIRIQQFESKIIARLEITNEMNNPIGTNPKTALPMELVRIANIVREGLTGWKRFRTFRRSRSGRTRDRSREIGC